MAYLRTKQRDLGPPTRKRKKKEKEKHIMEACIN
jgi:hypothetical protein